MKRSARASSGDNRGMQGVRGLGPETERAAGPLVESLVLHLGPVLGQAWAVLNWKVGLGPQGLACARVFEQDGALCAKGRSLAGCARCQFLAVTGLRRRCASHWGVSSVWHVANLLRAGLARVLDSPGGARIAPS